MKYSIAFFLILFSTCALAQNQTSVQDHFTYVVTPTYFQSTGQRSWHGLIRDPQLTYRPKSPLLTMLASTANFKNGHYWMGAITTQSYNRGKLGTYYLWDVQGNLRESRTFVDIAGRNKRGLKLVFRRR